MRSLIVQSPYAGSPDQLLPALKPYPGTILLCSGALAGPPARYSFLVTRPFLQFRCWGSECRMTTGSGTTVRTGNPWKILQSLLHRYEVHDEMDRPFPLGGLFGYWGYGMRHHVEPRLPERHRSDPAIPDACVGFYDSLVLFDHALGTTSIVATGLQFDGSRSLQAAQHQLHFWEELLASSPAPPVPFSLSGDLSGHQASDNEAVFIQSVQAALNYIRAGHIYQVNLAHRLQAAWPHSGSDLFRKLLAVSPAPYAAYLDGGDFQLASSSPESFLKFSGRHVTTRPIKGTRPRSSDPQRDAQWAYELQTSAKELAELLMITDLLRNDLGRICDYGSIVVPELARLEKFPHVQHLVATVEGQLRPELSQLEALAQCFPGGSVTGAPKIRAMQIIDELESKARGPYTGALGYLGFNGESELSIMIRTAVVTSGAASFHTGAGIVADSSPEAEFAETLAKAAGFLAAISTVHAPSRRPSSVPEHRPAPDQKP